MKNSLKLIASAAMMFLTINLFAQNDMHYNKTDSTKSDKMILQKNTGTKYQSDSLQMNKNKSKTDQKNNASPYPQQKRDSSDMDPHRMRNSTPTPVSPADTVK